MHNIWNCVTMKSFPLCGLLFMKKLEIMSSIGMNNICSFGTYMEHETLKCFGRCIVHKRDKFKDSIHGLKMSLLVHTLHRVHLATKFVLKCLRSKRGKHFHLILCSNFLVLVFDLGG
ncbi:hypothetical protein GLYMA_08G299450v4 [Glycine max]|nr:hypothetical protein GLYMA_08G299450v4 [Glycine max]KAH1053815.1 hypothetical protein GYH30_022857 [Glycine max]